MMGLSINALAIKPLSSQTCNKINLIIPSPKEAAFGWRVRKMLGSAEVITLPAGGRGEQGKFAV